ncbi:MAG: hypothetical protein IJ525_00380 [Alphaproteobacteria bacterium]|nr:hypothetical protein [Alphaproteobacteria bacterium]
MKNFEIKNESGRSMIEMLGVLAIIGVLSVGGIAGYSKAMTKYRINKTIEQITLIAGNVRAFFAPQHNYDGLDSCSDDNSYCKLIRKAKLIPDEMWDDTYKRFKNVFGYRVDLMTKNRSTDGDKQAFDIYYSIGDNMETCIELLSYDWRMSGAQAIQIGGPAGAVNFKLPVAVDKAVEACSETISKNRMYGGSFPDMLFFFDINLNSTYWSSLTWAN